MKEKLLEIASYHNSMDAEFARMALDSNGIECFMVDKGASPLVPIYTEKSPTHFLKVNQKDFDAAREILKNQKEEQNRTHQAWCPNCDSENVVKSKRYWWQTLLIILSIGVFSIFFTEQNECNNCGHKWI